MQALQTNDKKKEADKPKSGNNINYEETFRKSITAWLNACIKAIKDDHTLDNTKKDELTTFNISSTLEQKYQQFVQRLEKANSASTPEFLLQLLFFVLPISRAALSFEKFNTESNKKSPNEKITQNLSKQIHEALVVMNQNIQELTNIGAAITSNTQLKNFLQSDALRQGYQSYWETQATPVERSKPVSNLRLHCAYLSFFLNMSSSFASQLTYGANVDVTVNQNPSLLMLCLSRPMYLSSLLCCYPSLDEVYIELSQFDWDSSERLQKMKQDCEKGSVTTIDAALKKWKLETVGPESRSQKPDLEVSLDLLSAYQMLQAIIDKSKRIELMSNIKNLDNLLLTLEVHWQSVENDAKLIKKPSQNYHDIKKIYSETQDFRVSIKPYATFIEDILMSTTPMLRPLPLLSTNMNQFHGGVANFTSIQAQTKEVMERILSGEKLLSKLQNLNNETKSKNKVMTDVDQTKLERVKTALNDVIRKGLLVVTAYHKYLVSCYLDEKLPSALNWPARLADTAKAFINEFKRKSLARLFCLVSFLIVCREHWVNLTQKFVRILCQLYKSVCWHKMNKH